MTIDKAIEILGLAEIKSSSHIPPDLKDAIQLGIEALELLRHQRTYLLRAQETILLGETEK